MNIELAIGNITPANKRHKLITAAHALSDLMGLDAAIGPPLMEKAKTHKYVSKKLVNGQWVYAYPQTNNERRVNTANQTELITGIQPLSVTPSNVVNVVNGYFATIQQAIDRGVKCKWLQGRKVAGINTNHFFMSHGQERPIKTLLERAALLPFVLPLIEKYGHVSHAEKRADGGYYYELTGKAEINGKKHAVSLVLTDQGKDLLYISVIGQQKNTVKSLAWASGLHHEGPKAAVGKETLSFDHDLIIPHIWAKSIAPYPNIEVLIKGVTAQNRKAKFAKAMSAISKTLKVPAETMPKHEQYFYPVQQELSDYWTGYYSRLLKEVYQAVCNALDLPETQVETAMRKAIGDSGILRYRGKVIYNPQTGQPLKNRDFDALIESIQKFLNRNTKDISKQILLDSTAIGKLLRRMAKYQSSTDMTRLKLDGMKYRGKTFDWIRSDIKNLASVLGQPLTDSEMARYQAAKDYVGELVTRSNLKIRNEIKDTVLSSILNRRSKGQVSQDLFNRLGGLNRDWKRIADTEIVNTSNLAGILEEVNNAPAGEKVYFRRYELPGCCDKCAKVNGKIVLWSDTPLDNDKIKDEHADTAIWEGKAPDSKAGALVPGTLHPNCRGGWERWGGKRADAMSAAVQGKIDAWDKAVKQAKQEWAEKGIQNPNDQTPGYVDRINELYEENLKSGA